MITHNVYYVKLDTISLLASILTTGDVLRVHGASLNEVAADEADLVPLLFWSAGSAARANGTS